MAVATPGGKEEMPWFIPYSCCISVFSTLPSCGGGGSGGGGGGRSEFLEKTKAAREERQVRKLFALIPV